MDQNGEIKGPLDADPVAAQLLQDLLQCHGPLVGGKALYHILGYPSAGAFRQAWYRRHLSVPVFSIPHRRGGYALTRDIAVWLATLRATSNESIAEGRSPCPE